MQPIVVTTVISYKYQSDVNHIQLILLVCTYFSFTGMICLLKVNLIVLVLKKNRHDVT